MTKLSEFRKRYAEDLRDGKACVLINYLRCRKHAGGSYTSSIFAVHVFDCDDWGIDSPDSFCSCGASEIQAELDIIFGEDE